MAANSLFTSAAQPTSTPEVSWISVPGWQSFGWLWHGFSTRRGGVSHAYLSSETAEIGAGELNLGFTEADTADNVLENRRLFRKAITGNGKTFALAARQIHSPRSVVVSASLAEAARAIRPEAPFIPDCDGQMTSEAGLLLSIQTADCIPVLAVDPANRAVAAFHAGWRGTVERIVQSGIGQMQREFGSEPDKLLAAIGPGIGRCCYTVGEEVRERFERNFSYADALFDPDATAQTGIRLDLIEANRRQLLEAGLPASSVSVVGGCTSCQPELFFSHRASRGHAGRMMAVIGIKPNVS